MNPLFVKLLVGLLLSLSAAAAHFVFYDQSVVQFIVLTIAVTLGVFVGLLFTKEVPINVWGLLAIVVIVFVSIGVGKALETYTSQLVAEPHWVSYFAGAIGRRIVAIAIVLLLCLWFLPRDKRLSTK